MQASASHGGSEPSDILQVNGCTRNTSSTNTSKLSVLTAYPETQLVPKAVDPPFEFPLSSYEFVDVVIEGTKLKNERFFVDIYFMAQFEIARPTTSYNNLLQKLPTLFVGKADKLCSVVKIMCDAARRSLKDKEMYIPPWRKYRYMQNKWLASYKRTTNPAAAGAAKNALFEFPYPGMELQAMRSNASVLVDQREKGNVASEKNLTAKSKYTEQSNERFETRDLFLKIGDRGRHANRISGLATALAEAGLTTMIPLKS